MRTNEVTLFSNGIGHFRRIYKVNSPSHTISIPFAKDHIGDVAASLQIFGNVKMVCPPTFTPANSLATTLKVEATNAIRSLVTGLSGAKIKVQTGANVWIEGTLVGLNIVNLATSSGKVEKDHLSVLTSEGQIKQCNLENIWGFEFLEDVVKAEVAKALKVNFNRIKPDSVFLDLTLSAEGEQEMEIQYTIPVAAWKMRYAIREQKQKFVFEGAAIIDNNTDEDWDQFLISVVTGNPISFATDIATVVVPQRKMVQLVDGSALGNVMVQEGLESTRGYARKGVRAASAMAYSNAMSAPRAALMCASATPDYDGCQADMVEEMENVFAEAAAVETKEVGDFCVFSCQAPITIQAKKSSVVPMFSVPLDQVGTVLFYKQENHARRPFRAVKFTNTTDYSLGKGKVIVYKDGVFSGECVLEQTKPKDNRMLPHCLENGVRIVSESKSIQTVQSLIRLSKGVAVSEVVHTAVTEYAVENRKDEEFQVVIEHPKQWVDSTLTCVGVESPVLTKIPNGSHVSFAVKVNEKVTLVVTETLVQATRTALESYWLQANVIQKDNPLGQDKGVLACIKIQEAIDEIDQQIQEKESAVEELTGQMERVRENIRAAGANAGGDTVQGWITDLNSAETTLRQIEKVDIPTLKRAKKVKEQELREALRELTAEWHAITPPVAEVKNADPVGH